MFNLEELYRPVLGYRGLVFACGLLRHFESLLNNRQNLRLFNQLPAAQVALAPLAGQFCAIAAGALIAWLAGLAPQWPALLLLSLYVYPYFANITRRARHYARFDASTVNSSLLAGVFTLLGAVWLGATLAMNAPSVLAAALILSELAVFTVFLTARHHPESDNASSPCP